MLWCLIDALRACNSGRNVCTTRREVKCASPTSQPSCSNTCAAIDREMRHTWDPAIDCAQHIVQLRMVSSVQSWVCDIDAFASVAFDKNIKSFI